MPSLLSSPWPDEVFTLPGSSRPLVLEDPSGEAAELDHHRWHADADGADCSLLAKTRGPVLDIGCGPGRLTRSLIDSGRVALGVDASAKAVAAARRRGAPAVHASVFGVIPWTGLWGTVLVADGNIGIGGDPTRLLRRARQLLAPGGVLLVEVEPPGTSSENMQVRVRHGGRHGSWFPWSRVSVTDLVGLAGAIGMDATCVWSNAGRWFVEIGSPPHTAQVLP